jgi:hypothetical protein
VGVIAGARRGRAVFLARLRAVFTDRADLRAVFLPFAGFLAALRLGAAFRFTARLVFFFPRFAIRDTSW